jgi:S-adenosylmethionine-diacylglycerol 3-amino-3-carboxypropyl transferase
MTSIEVADTLNITRRRSKELVGAAVHRHLPLSRAGLSERMFTFFFSGLVYPQIWEDPAVDIEAMQLRPGHDVVAIASGGCNILSYLTVAPLNITGVDLNTAHVALNRLKHAAVRELDYADFHSMFVNAASKKNITIFDDKLAHCLDAETKHYWSGRAKIGRRRIDAFAHGFYRTGLLGRFIATGHTLAHLLGGRPGKMVTAQNLEEQKRIFEQELRPLLRKKIVRKILDRPSALFGLGIPPSQYEALAGGRAMHDVIEERLEQLACGFDLNENYFAWQAFNRGYAPDGQGPVPPYLEQKNFETLQANIHGAQVLNVSLTTHLADQPAASLDRYVLLDAQDWMTDADLTALWQEITRTARPGARVIFRTAGKNTILPGRVPECTLAQWDYRAQPSKGFTARDRSAIYGGFHLYVKGA